MPSSRVLKSSHVPGHAAHQERSGLSGAPATSTDAPLPLKDTDMADLPTIPDTRMNGPHEPSQQASNRAPHPFEIVPQPLTVPTTDEDRRLFTATIDETVGEEQVTVLFACLAPDASDLVGTLVTRLGLSLAARAAVAFGFDPGHPVAALLVDPTTSARLQIYARMSIRSDDHLIVWREWRRER